MTGEAALADGQIGESALALVDDGLDVFEASRGLRDNDSVIIMVDSAAERRGGIDHLANIAGHPVMVTASPASDLESQTEELWSEVLSVNLMPTFRTAKAAAPYLRGSKGVIVNTSAMSGWRGGGSSSPDRMAKDGIITLTKELARGLGPEVRVNAISPSYVHPDSMNFPPRWESVFEDCEALPLGRPGTAVEYADACLFLCAGASYITGQTVHVDGGWSA